MIEILWVFLLVLAGLVALMILGVAGILAYYMIYSLACLITGRPNKLNLTEKTFDIKPEDEK